ncbi:hypothetical protein EVAR_13691_1 [Eumeta japonica]|uniref:Uncharacterized protein n=1 Tax=Eumeta variegata TaxID=151549 RepID=A0A4C1UBC5_EUMVA|nr:hypothetical protein EVAR_13691_1 [Eumeta japonica]
MSPRLVKRIPEKEGLSPEVMRTIYITVIEPIVLYTSWAWRATPATGKLGVRKMLDAVQRSVAFKACRAHRSVSAFRADPLDAALSRHKSEGSGLVVRGKARKRFRGTCASPCARARNRV